MYKHTVKRSVMITAFGILIVLSGCVWAIDLTFDIGNTEQIVKGFGAQIWAGDMRVEEVIEDLDLKYVRMSKASLAALKRSWNITDRHGVRVIFHVWSASEEWLDSSNNLKSQHLPDFAADWGDYIADLYKYDMYPPYIELSNEPDGDWNTFISPGVYDDLVKLVRAELDSLGFQDVGIIGPGRAHTDVGSSDIWIKYLDDDAVSALSGWSAHAWLWNEGINQEDGQSVLRTTWTGFENSILTKDPDRTKPLIITEYATSASTFQGISYPSQSERNEYSASDTVPYAVRVYENTLSLINLGANIMILWEAADQDWSPHEWGLIKRPSEGSTPRPVYNVLKTLLPKIPADARAITAPSQEDNDLYAAALVKDSILVIGLANGTSAERGKSIQFTGIEFMEILEALAFVEGETTNAEVILNPETHTIDVSLPPVSTLTVVCNLDPEWVTVSETSDSPSEFEIFNYPNPFNAATSIEFSLPAEAFATVGVYNIEGQKVRNLLAEQMEAGRYHVVWDGNNDYGFPVSSGTYIALLKTGNTSRTGKMMLMK